LKGKATKAKNSRNHHPGESTTKFHQRLIIYRGRREPNAPGASGKLKGGNLRWRANRRRGLQFCFSYWRQKDENKERPYKNRHQKPTERVGGVKGNKRGAKKPRNKKKTRRNQFSHYTKQREASVHKKGKRKSRSRARFKKAVRGHLTKHMGEEGSFRGGREQQGKTTQREKRRHLSEAGGEIEVRRIKK